MVLLNYCLKIGWDKRSSFLNPVANDEETKKFITLTPGVKVVVVCPRLVLAGIFGLAKIESASPWSADDPDGGDGDCLVPELTICFWNGLFWDNLLAFLSAWVGGKKSSSSSSSARLSSCGTSGSASASASISASSWRPVKHWNYSY